MAGGKLSPRQRMINLMYLVFIAMLAMNMSKEVLSAFGLLNDRLSTANIAADQRNVAFLDNLNLKAEEQPEKYVPLREKAGQIDKISKEFNSYLEEVKKGLQTSVNPEVIENNNYEAMDKTDYFDLLFFRGEGLTEDGQAFLDNINNYRSKLNELLGDEQGFEDILAEVNDKFNTDEVKRGDGATVSYLNYHFQGFPMIASLTKLTQLQNDVKNTNSQILTKMLEGQMTADLSMSKFTTLLESTRSAYFQGDTFDGAIVLGKKDATSKPNEVNLTLDGRQLAAGTDFTIEDGRVLLNVSAGAAGEHKLAGELIFMEGGEPTPVPVNLSFTTITRPTDAVISADKMNVLYRGVKNPITVSMAGVSDHNINVNAPGLSKVSGSKYLMDVTTVQGREVTINVSGKIDDKSYPSKATFRIKDIPRPVGTIRGEDGIVKMQRSNLEISTVGAALIDFDFDVSLNVTEFKFNVPGQPTVVVSGNKLNAAAVNALKRATPKSTVQIFDIKATLVGSSGYILPKISPVFIELTN